MTYPPEPAATVANPFVKKIDPSFTGEASVVAPEVFASPHKVYLMGDSLTGTSDHYGTQLQTSLGAGWTVVWKGISGNNTTQMLARFTADVITPAVAEYVVILGGVNDLARAVATSAIKSNLQAMYTAAKAAGIKVVAVTILPFSGDVGWDDPSDGPSARSKQEEINDWILHRAINVDYRIDAYAALVDPSVPWTLLPAYDDGGHIHLSTAGYVVLGNAIRNGTTWSAVRDTAVSVTGLSSFVGAIAVTGVVVADNLTGMNTGDENFGQDVLSVDKGYGYVKHASPSPIYQLLGTDSTTFHGFEFRNGGNRDAAITQKASTGEMRIEVGRSVGWGGRITFVFDTVDRASFDNVGNLTVPTIVSGAGTFTDTLMVSKNPAILKLNSTINTAATGVEWTTAGGVTVEASLKQTANTSDMVLSVGRSVGWGGQFDIDIDTVNVVRVSPASVAVTGTVAITGNQINIATAKTPASASATGVTGSICWDASYFYVCTATNQWRRVAHATW